MAQSTCGVLILFGIVRDFPMSEHWPVVSVTLCSPGCGPSYADNTHCLVHLVSNSAATTN